MSEHIKSTSVLMCLHELADILIEDLLLMMWMTVFIRRFESSLRIESAAAFVAD